MSGDDRCDSPADGAVDLIAFFRALGPEARREYDALARRIASSERTCAPRQRRRGRSPMIPNPEAIARAYAVIAPELGVASRASEAAIRVALARGRPPRERHL